MDSSLCKFFYAPATLGRVRGIQNCPCPVVFSLDIVWPVTREVKVITPYDWMIKYLETWELVHLGRLMPSKFKVKVTLEGLIFCVCGGIHAL